MAHFFMAFKAEAFVAVRCCYFGWIAAAIILLSKIFTNVVAAAAKTTTTTTMTEVKTWEGKERIASILASMYEVMWKSYS